MRLLLLQGKEEGEKNGKAHTEDHHHAFMLPGIGKLLILLQEGAKHVAAKQHGGKKKPLEGHSGASLSLLPLSRDKAKEHRKDDHSDAERRREREAVPAHEIPPDGNEDKGKLLDKGGKRHRARRKCADHTEHRCCIADAIKNRIEQDLRLKGEIKGIQNAPAEKSKDHHQEGVKAGNALSLRVFPVVKGGKDRKSAHADHTEEQI